MSEQSRLPAIAKIDIDTGFPESQLVGFAPVRAPEPESLAIGLVPSDIVYRLEEYRSDQMRWEAVMWAFIGAILGIIINWVTTEPISISRASVILLATFIIMAGVTWLAVRDYRMRAERMRDAMLKFKHSSHSSKASAE